MMNGVLELAWISQKVYTGVLADVNLVNNNHGHSISITWRTITILLYAHLSEELRNNQFHHHLKRLIVEFFSISPVLSVLEQSHSPQHSKPRRLPSSPLTVIVDREKTLRLE